MENEQTTLRSTVLPSVMHRLLWRGSCFAIAGAACLLIPGILMPPLLMGVWGLPTFILGMGLIAWGLIPYRRLRSLEENPYRLILVGETALTFTSKGKPLFTTPRKSIEEIRYFEKENTYGIALWLKSPLPEKLQVENESFDLNGFRERSKKVHGCDLFLPYFSQRSFTTLEDWLMMDHQTAS